MSDCRYHIAVDFGSESMAACFIETHMQSPVDIDLQTRGPSVRGGCELLKEENGTQSKRLRTRIGLNKDVTIDEQALARETSVDLDLSVFEFFHQPMQEYVRPLLPNLKLLYQSAVRELLPEKAQTANPESILASVILQIVRNIVLRGKELIDYAAKHSGGLKGSQVHLILTVPNVYSISHAGKLKAYIEKTLTIGGEPAHSVETMYESDALAHYLMYSRDEPAPSLDGALQRIRRAGENGSILNVLTVDIGRGTTDISFATYRRRHEDAAWLYDLKSRTGRTHGGGRLTYLVAKALDDRLQEAYESWVESLPSDSAQQVKQHPIRITSRSATGIMPEARLVSAIEKYVEAVKRSWDDSLRLSSPTQLRDQYLSDLPAALHLYFKDEASPPDIDRFAAAVMDAMMIPARLRADDGLGLKTVAMRLAARAGRRFGIDIQPPPVADRFGQLADEIHQYVDTNTGELLGWMAEMVEATENAPRFHRLLRNTETVVMIGGQGGQFEPLRVALTAHVQQWNLNVQPGGNVVFLRGAEAKFACCHGAVMRHRIKIVNLRPDRVMGSYGFLDSDVLHHLQFIDMQQFHVENHEQIVQLPEDAFHRFVYLPRYFKDRVLKGDTVTRLVTEGGALAYLWPIPQGGPVAITNRGVDGIGLKYRGYTKNEEQVTDNAAFGDVKPRGEHIYTRTWPEILRPAK